MVGVDSLVSTVVQNTSDTPMTVALAFGWADFGMGIPFTTTGMTPALRTVPLAPGTMQTATVTWEPVQSGHQCVQIQLSDVGGVYEPQLSQRNVDVAERPPCNTTQVYTFTIYNNTPLAVTVETGLITFNVPAEWVITVTPSPTLELPAWGPRGAPGMAAPAVRGHLRLSCRRRQFCGYPVGAEGGGDEDADL